MQQSINQMLYSLTALNKLGGIQGEVAENRKEVTANTREVAENTKQVTENTKQTEGWRETLFKNLKTSPLKLEFSEPFTLASTQPFTLASIQASNQAMSNVANQATAVQNQASNYNNLIKQLKGLTEGSDRVANNSTKKALTKILEEHGGNE